MIRKDAWLGLFLLLACGLVVTLSMQNRRLRGAFAQTLEEQTRPATGSWVPTASTSTLDGRRVLLGLASRKAQVLYFFDTSCHYCRDSAPFVRALVEGIGHEGLATDLVGVARLSDAALPGYLQQHHFAFPVGDLSPKLQSIFGVRVVPLLIAVDGDGRVLFSHAGPFQTREKVDSLLAVLRATERHAGLPSKRNAR